MRARRAAALARAAACAVLPLLLGGCLSRVIPEPPPPPLTYDFGPPPDVEPAPLSLPFTLENVSAPSWLRTPNIYYRRLDQHRGALQPYARNQWIAATPELFAERLADRLARAAPAAADARLPLRLEIVRFEHVYTAANESYVIARARASFDGFDGRVRRREFEHREPAAASVHGATAALPRVADTLLDGVLEWLRSETLDLER